MKVLKQMAESWNLDREAWGAKSKLLNKEFNKKVQVLRQIAESWNLDLEAWGSKSKLLNKEFNRKLSGMAREAKV